MRVKYPGLLAATMGKDITPYPYQLALANSPWPDALKVETGMGKTTAVILAWVHKRLLNDPHPSPTSRLLPPHAGACRANRPNRPCMDQKSQGERIIPR